MQGTGSNTSACASCKHQRKKCTEKCALSPYFTIAKSREFQAVHKIFGVSNITKILMNLREQEHRERAADSLVWEALSWRKDPVHGPFGEYRRICEELRMYKSYYQQLHQPRQSERLINKVNKNKDGIKNCHVYPYGLPTHQGQETDNVRVERENPLALILPKQQLVNGLNQRSLLPVPVTDPYNPFDSKSLESTTLWEGSS